MPFLRKWPWLFGTLAEVNDMLAEVKVPEPARRLLDQLKTVAEFAGELADQQVIVDLSSAVPQKYYTGIVMKGYVEKTTGAYLISGGRYNRLLANFQSQLEPAVGLGINIDALAEAAALKPVKSSRSLSMHRLSFSARPQHWSKSTVTIHWLWPIRCRRLRSRPKRRERN